MFKYVKKQIKPIIILSIIGTAQVICRLSFIWLSKKAIDAATKGAFLTKNTAEAIITNAETNIRNLQEQTLFDFEILQSFNPLALFCILMAILVFTEVILSGMALKIKSLSIVKGENSLRHKIFEHILFCPSIDKEKHSGDTLNRLSFDVKEIINLNIEIIPNIIIFSFQLLGGLMFLFWLSPFLAICLLSIAPFFILISRVFAGKLKNIIHKVRKGESKTHQFIQEAIQNRALIQVLEQSPNFAANLTNIHADLYDKVQEKTKFSFASKTIVTMGFAAGYLAAFIYGINQLSIGAISFGIMAAFLQLVAIVQAPIARLASMYPSLIGSLAAKERIDELMGQEPENQEIQINLRGQNSQLTNIQVGIKFKNVHFSYKKGEKEVFSNFSFDFTPGSKTAILGATGAGKSSLAKLILALQKPQKGKIELYSTEGEIASVSSQTRCNIIYVPQGNSLFSGSIRENLLMGDPNASDLDLQRVLKIASAEFVFDLSQGLESICGEKGISLSEGEAQRIAIARSLLRHGEILILDESTSALDFSTQQKVLENICFEFPSKTLIFITHRPEAASFCNQILKI